MWGDQFVSQNNASWRSLCLDVLGFVVSLLLHLHFPHSTSLLIFKTVELLKIQFSHFFVIYIFVNYTLLFLEISYLS